METFQAWYARSPLASALRVFVSIILAAAIADWSTKGVIDLAAWQTWVIAGAVSVLPTITRALNPADAQFGAGAEARNLFDVFDEEENL